MNNNQVILSLNDAIEKLQLIIRLLEEKRDNIGGPVAERVDKYLRITAEIDLLNTQLRNLELQRIQRRRARSIGEAVEPLSDEERERLEAGLAALSASVAAVADIRAALDLASEIAGAASEVSGAVS